MRKALVLMVAMMFLVMGTAVSATETWQIKIGAGTGSLLEGPNQFIQRYPDWSLDRVELNLPMAQLETNFYSIGFAKSIDSRWKFGLTLNYWPLTKVYGFNTADYYWEDEWGEGFMQENVECEANAQAVSADAIAYYNLIPDSSGSFFLIGGIGYYFLDFEGKFRNWGEIHDSWIDDDWDRTHELKVSDGGLGYILGIALDWKPFWIETGYNFGPVLKGEVTGDNITTVLPIGPFNVDMSGWFARGGVCIYL